MTKPASKPVANQQTPAQPGPEKGAKRPDAQPGQEAAPKKRRGFLDRLKASAGVLAVFVPLAAAEYGAIHQLRIQPLEDEVERLRSEQEKWSGAVAKEDFQALSRERDQLRSQVAGYQGSARKVPEVIRYLENLEQERTKADREIELLLMRLGQEQAAAAAAQRECEQSRAQGSEPQPAICATAAQHDAAAKSLPATIDLKRKRSESLTQQLQDAQARLGPA